MTYDLRIVVRDRTDPRLGRSVHHDSRSRAYAFTGAGVTLKTVQHERHIPVLDQGALGSCTGNAGIGCLGTGLFFTDRGTQYTLDESGAIWLYSDATHIDPYAGTYPPVDTGSDGLSVAKALKSAGEIAGYTHAFSLNAALAAFVMQPVIVGTDWTDDMFTPDEDGRVHPTGPVAGGHEYVIDGIDVENKRVWATNSWGASFGLGGRFWLTWDDFGALLKRDGDVTIFTPLTQPAPTPTPPVPPQPAPPADPDVVFAAAAKAWLATKGL